MLGCPSLKTLERNHMPHALVRARHHSNSMRWRRHVDGAPNGAPFRRRGSHDQIAVERPAHAMPPTVCAHSSVRCGSEPWSVERETRATSAHASRK